MANVIPVPRSWAERASPTLMHYNLLPTYGHFAAWEQPALVTEEMRAGVDRCGDGGIAAVRNSLPPSCRQVFGKQTVDELVVAPGLSQETALHRLRQEMAVCERPAPSG
jgi:hypothetical protein